MLNSLKIIVLACIYVLLCGSDSIYLFCYYVCQYVYLHISLNIKRTFYLCDYCRFFFLSNDELLDIYGQSRNLQTVQTYLRKCFDAIFKLEINSDIGGKEICFIGVSILILLSNN